MAPLDPYALYGALHGVRAYVERIEERRVLGLPIGARDTADAIAFIDRALGPEAPPVTHRDTPERMARVDALAALFHHPRLVETA